MRKWLRTLALMLTSLLPNLGVAQTTAFYTDRAVATFPFVGQRGGITAMVPIQYGQVRVCTAADIGGITSPCPDLATITDIFGTTLGVAGGSFGQVTTDVVGRFSFGCSPGNYLVQVAATGSNTPQLSYPITCPAPNAQFLTDVTITAAGCIKWGSSGVTTPDLFLCRQGPAEMSISSAALPANSADGIVDLFEPIITGGGFVGFRRTGVPPNLVTASLSWAAASTLQVGDGGVNANGNLKVGNGAFHADALRLGADNNGFWAPSPGANIAVEASNNDTALFTGGGLSLGSGKVYCWSSAAGATGNSCDTTLGKSAAGVVEVGTGTTPNSLGSMLLTNLTNVALGTATSGGNFGSGSLQLNGSWWNGSAAVAENWTINEAPSSTVPNPNNSFLNIVHSAGIPNAQIDLFNNNVATAGTNFNGPSIDMIGHYWNGAASAGDETMLRAVLGAGTNPTNTFTLTHAGTSGAFGVDFTVASFFSLGGTPVASVGTIRMQNGFTMQVRNSGNTADLPVVQSSGNQIVFGANSEITTSGVVSITASGAARFVIPQNPAFNVAAARSDGGWGWSSATTPSTAFDTVLSRPSAGVVSFDTSTVGNALGTGKATIFNALTGFQINGGATANQALIGNGTNFVPTVLTLASSQFANQGTGSQVLHGNIAGNPSWAAVSSADLNITTTTCTNQFLTAIGSSGVGVCTTATLASAQFANQGTTTTVLHGNAAGNPSFAAVSLTADISGILGTTNGGTGVNSTATFPTSGVVVTEAATETLGSKRVTPRVVTMADAVSVTPTSDTADINIFSSSQVGGTLTVNAPSGTPTDGQSLTLRLKSTNAQTYSFNVTYAFSTSVIAPTTLAAGKTDYIGLRWDATNTKWDVVAVDQGH